MISMFVRHSIHHVNIIQDFRSWFVFIYPFAQFRCNGFIVSDIYLRIAVSDMLDAQILSIKFSPPSKEITMFWTSEALRLLLLLMISILFTLKLITFTIQHCNYNYTTSDVERSYVLLSEGHCDCLAPNSKRFSQTPLDREKSKQNAAIIVHMQRYMHKKHNSNHNTNEVNEKTSKTSKPGGDTQTILRVI